MLSMKFWSPNTSQIVNAPRDSNKIMLFLAISVPTVTTTLQKTSNSDENREDREKCQRIIDYVFGNGPFPYSDISGFDEVQKENIAQKMTQHKQNTDDEQQTQNKEDETVIVNTIVTSEDQPEIISARKNKKAPSSDNTTKNLEYDDEAHLTVVDNEKTMSTKSDFTIPLPCSEVQIPKINSNQKVDTDQKKKSNNINIQNPFKLMQIKPLVMCNKKIKDAKCHDKINTTDDDFLYENSCGEEIREEPRTTNSITKKEVTSNIAGHRENTQDYNNKITGDKNKVKLITDEKRNEEKQNSQKNTISELTDKNTKYPSLKITENKNKIQDIINQLPGDSCVHVTSEGTKDEYLKPTKENAHEIQFFEIPTRPFKILSSKTKTKIKSSTTPELKNPNRDFVGKAGKFQSDCDSNGDREIVEIEIYLPTNVPERSRDYDKAKTKEKSNKINTELNISDKENENPSSLHVPLISHTQNDHNKIMLNQNYKTEKVAYFKEPSTDSGEKIILDCNKKSFFETIGMDSKAPSKVTKDTGETINDERQLKYKENKIGQETEDNGNPLKNVVCDPNAYHFDYFSNQTQNQLSFSTEEKSNSKDIDRQNQNLTGSEIELWITRDQLLRAIFIEQKKDEYPTCQQNPQQHARSISQKQSVEMFSPKSFFIQNRPAIPAPNEHGQKFACMRKSPKSNKQKKKVGTPRKLLKPSHAQSLEPAKKGPSIVEHDTNLELWSGDALTQQKMGLQQYSMENKLGKALKPTLIQFDHEPETKLQKPISSNKNISSSLQKRHEWKHKLDNLECNEDIITQVKKQLPQLYTPESTIDTEHTPNSKIQQEMEDESNEQQVDRLNEICSSTNWPTPEFKITKEMPLSEVMRVIRLRNQFLFIKEFLQSVEMSKCGDKKPDCPPKAPTCPESPPCPPPKHPSPPPPPPPPPCTPVPTKPKPHPKCDCKCKYIAVKNISSVLPRRISECCNIDTPAAVIQPYEQEDLEDAWVDTGHSILFARSFDPWVPIPNYPYPKKEIPPSLVCDPRCKPKKIPVYVKPKEQPCTGFPKRLCCSSIKTKNFVVLW